VNVFWQELRYALRGMLRAPLLTIAMVLTLAVGIGLNSGVFTSLDVALLQAPVDKDPATFVRAVARYTGWYKTEDFFDQFTALDYQAMRDQARSLTNLAAWHGDEAFVENETAKTGVMLVSCNYFSLYGFGRPKLGRQFRSEECSVPGASPVAVISERFWKNRFGADPQIVGKPIQLNRHAYTIIGVNDSGSIARLGGDAGIWVPYTMQPDFWQGHNAFKRSDWYGWAWLTVEGRLNPGYSRSDAQAELNLIVRQQDRLYPGSHEDGSYSGRRTKVIVTNGSVIENPRVHPLAILVIALVMGPLSMVLLIACGNVTVLLLSRGSARRGEIAIRLALGARRARILRLLAVEGAIVAAAGGVLSLALVIAFPTVVRWIVPGFAFRVAPNWAAFGYLGGVTLITASIAGFMPAAESLKVDLVTTLKQQQGTSSARSRVRSFLMTAQVAMSFVLVAGAVIFAHLQYQMQSGDVGFETAHLFLVSASYLGPDSGSGTVQERDSAISFYSTLEQRLRALPGVTSIAYSQSLPLGQSDTQGIRLPGEETGQGRQASLDFVSVSFFQTVGIPIVRGRGFQISDAPIGGQAPSSRRTPAAQEIGAVGVISQAFARAFWPGQDPIGKVLEWGDPNTRVQVVGVARDTKSEKYGQVDGPRLYALMNWNSGGPLMIRFEGDSNSLGQGIEQTVQGLDQAQRVVPVTFKAIVDRDAEDLRPLTLTVAFVACLAVALALVGIYGVVVFSANQRRREFGIRMVLGATKGRIASSVLIAGAKQVGLGLLLGMLLALPGAWALARFFQASHFYLGAFDVGTYVVAALMLFLVALAAMYFPTRRAMRVDPMVALRYE